MLDESRMRWTSMLNQARAFAEHAPQDALARASAVLHEVEAKMAADPASAATLQGLHDRASTQCAEFAGAYARYQAESSTRTDAYSARIQREMSVAPRR